MDWEIYEKYRSTLLLAFLLLSSAIMLAFKQSAGVRALQSFLVRFALPPQHLIVRSPVIPVPTAPGEVSPSREDAAMTPGAPLDAMAEFRRKVQTLTDENIKLRDVLRLKTLSWPKAVPAHVVGRDPQKWFQEIVLNKGTDDGLHVDDPVIAVDQGRQALIGRITEISAHFSKVMLLQDPLSSVAAEIRGLNGEDGLVEGGNSHELYLRYLGRSSQVKIGDEVVTSGLGLVFPPGIPIGMIQSVEPDPRQLFLQAVLHPAIKSSALRTVLVIQMNRDQE